MTQPGTRRGPRAPARLGWALVLLWLQPPAAGAEVERLEVSSRETQLDGRPFGLAGPYERLTGSVHFALDPAAAVNAAIVDLEHAPRGADGKVRFRADFYLLKPLAPGAGNGALLIDVPNRGTPLGLLFNFPDHPLRPRKRPFGDGFVMRRGFTVAGVGWQMDLEASRPSTLRLETVTAAGDGLGGLARADAIFLADTDTMPLGHWGHRAVPVADPADPRNTLTERATADAPRRPIPRRRWRFARIEAGREVAADDAVVLDGGFAAGTLYEVVYAAGAPRVAGLGLAAVRDFASYLAHAEDSPVRVERTLAFGGSQTGRFLRHFLYQGFNVDAAGRRVLDGVLATVAGAGRGSFNHRYAQPSRLSSAFLGCAFPSDLFPFASATSRDPLSGVEDGLLAAADPAARPKIIQLNTGWEYWARGASLIHTTPDGAADLASPPDERLYTYASAAHVVAGLPPAPEITLRHGTLRTVHRTNPANFLWSERALLVALDAWVARGEEPPPSRLPRLDDGTLVRRQALAFPPVPGLLPPAAPYRPRRLDYGRRFAAQGIVDLQPPRSGPPFPALVPQVDTDGNDLGGIRLPEIAVPLGTFTGWNLRHPALGGGGQLADFVGGFVPFARSRAERLAAGDPRLSIEERYPSREAFVGRVTEAALALVEGGYLLAEDLPDVIASSLALWSFVQGLEQAAPATAAAGGAG